ncbi:uncharacterized protein LOC129737827 [Uranotaenia lowii]|uniref:uncharacterized protein LOC129737827 n=1 Tax=Uranotaenia lowii TaxID=190385 RepID=UPI002479ED91|nr:uncharacterized protein LOC129737827 [Uranotaenia lowii]
MSKAGKYVRAPAYENEEECEMEVPIPGKYVLLNQPEVVDAVGINDADVLDEDPYAIYNEVVDPEQESRELQQRVRDLERTIAEITGSKSSNVEHNKTSGSTPDQVTSSTIPPASTLVAANVLPYDSSAPSIRWDNIKSFPSGVPANKMWEAWTKYFENFEIAASLSNAYDPVKRSQLLYLSIGDELQGIVRAAKLRPTSSAPDCYTVIVNNIEGYLKGLTDTAAEHDMFSSMQQEKGESVINFHSRLREKVWLCGYSPSDQDRFVRTQLLKGLRNRELAKAARTYGHETDFIVQSATRDEAMLPEPSLGVDSTSIMAVSRAASRDTGTMRKRYNTFERNDGFKPKRIRTDFKPSLQRDGRCSRCNRAIHVGRRCPALDKDCYSCGRSGHYAKTCRQNASVL